MNQGPQRCVLTGIQGAIGGIEADRASTVETVHNTLLDQLDQLPRVFLIRSHLCGGQSRESVCAFQPEQHHSSSLLEIRKVGEEANAAFVVVVVRARDIHVALFGRGAREVVADEFPQGFIAIGFALGHGSGFFSGLCFGLLFE